MKRKLKYGEGRCNVCRRWFALRSDLVIRIHRHQFIKSVICEGSIDEPHPFKENTRGSIG